MLNRTFKIEAVFDVGGSLRDELLGKKVKDRDFAVEARSFRDMKEWLEFGGADIFVCKPEFLTIRCKLPSGHLLHDPKSPVADFVLCRSDADEGDGRRPLFVTPGTIFDDLARRDFTVNAMARNVVTREVIDPHGGEKDLENNLLKFVGNPDKRITEDGLRVLRAFRFEVTKGFTPEINTWDACTGALALEMLQKVSTERIFEELEKMFQHDHIATLRLLELLDQDMREFFFSNGIRLVPTMTKGK